LRGFRPRTKKLTVKICSWLPVTKPWEAVCRMLNSLLQPLGAIWRNSSVPTIARVRRCPTRELLMLFNEKWPGFISWYQGQSESSARSFAKITSNPASFIAWMHSRVLRMAGRPVPSSISALMSLCLEFWIKLISQAQFI